MSLVIDLLLPTQVAIRIIQLQQPLSPRLQSRCSHLVIWCTVRRLLLLLLSLLVLFVLFVASQFQRPDSSSSRSFGGSN